MRVKVPLLAILDRDGVLNVDKGYVYRYSDFEWQTGAKEAVRWLNKQGYTVVVATNQSGIGRGLYRSQDFCALTKVMMLDLELSGGSIASVYYCPHTPEDHCRCRKPNVGMLERAVLDWGGYREAFLIGDKSTDVLAAKQFGIPGYLFSGGNLLEFVKTTMGGDHAGTNEHSKRLDG